jgi:hypothetical protein
MLSMFGLKDEDKKEVNAEEKQEVQQPVEANEEQQLDAQEALEAKKRLDRLSVELLQLSVQGQVNHHRMGQIFNEAVDEGLATKAGYKSAEDYFCEKIRELSRSTLYIYGAVARAFSVEVCKQFGVTCLHQLLTYKRATDIQVDTSSPGATLIEVPNDKGEVERKPFYACGVEEMRKAIQFKRTPGTYKPMPRAERALGEKYVKALAGSFDKGEPVRIQLRNHHGKAVLDFRGIPVAQVGKLAELLMAKAFPGREVKQEQTPPQ